MTDAREKVRDDAAAQAGKPVLAVDLDGTLIRNDLFLDGIVQFILQGPFRLFIFLSWLLKGRAYAKARIAAAVSFDPATLPYDKRVVAFLEQEKAAGRRLVLATAGDRSVADAVAQYLGLFDDVVASDGTHNLKSQAKADALKARYGAFAYAGNERADLAVWRSAASGIVVNASRAIARQAARTTEIELEIPRERTGLKPIVKAIRPYQWAKNGLVFVPIVTAQALTDMAAWGAALIAFAAFCFTASAIYLINDLSDLEADRRHHRKRNRPFASGALSPVVGLALAVLLLAVGLATAAMGDVLLVTMAYGLTSALYTFRLKEIQLVDVFTLAGLYTIRLFAGGEATGYEVSLWLLGFSTFFFLSLALAKRTTELAGTEQRSVVKRRGYIGGDQAMLKIMGVASSFTACLVLALYIQSDLVAATYASAAVLWWLLPLVLYWSCRIWMLAEQDKMHDDPLVFALRDKVSWAVAGLAGLVLIGAAQGVPQI
jgi:4-hydroxybenzoate polyprenyltransferase/phosphoserine phosphatase